MPSGYLYWQHNDLIYNKNILCIGIFSDKCPIEDNCPHAQGTVNDSVLTAQKNAHVLSNSRPNVSFSMKHPPFDMEGTALCAL